MRRKKLPKEKAFVQSTKSKELGVMDRLLTLKGSSYPYGKIGLANYSKKVKHGFTELDVLYYETLPPTKLNIELVAQAQKKNFFTIYNSSWRLCYPSNYGPTIDFFSEYENLVNRVHVISFDELLVSFRERESMWLKNYKKILGSVRYDMERFAKSFHTLRTIVVFPKDMEYKTEYTNLLSDIWALWKFPFSDYPSWISFRFYVFTSSIPGNSVAAKLKFINDQHKHFRHMVCLVGDDLSLRDLAKIAKATEIRCTIDPFKCKDEDGKFATAKSSLLTKMFKFSSPKASTIYVSPIFMDKRDLKNHEKGLRVLNSYSKLSNVVIY